MQHRWLVYDRSGIDKGQLWEFESINVDCVDIYAFRISH